MAAAEFGDEVRQARQVVVHVARRVHAERVAPVALADPERRARTVPRLAEQRVAAERGVQELARLVLGEKVAVEVVCDVELADVEPDGRVARLQTDPRLAQEDLRVVTEESLRLGVQEREAAQRRVGPGADNGLDVHEQRHVRRGTPDQDEVERAEAEDVVLRPWGVHDPLHAAAQRPVDGEDGRDRRGGRQRLAPVEPGACGRLGLRGFLGRILR